MENQEEVAGPGENKKHTLAKKIVAGFAIISVLVIIVFVALKLKPSLTSSSKTPTKVNTETAQVFDPTAALKNIQSLRSEYSFPAFEYVKSDYKPSVPDYTIALDELKNLDSFSK